MIAQTLPLMISTSSQKARAMRCQNFAQKLTSRHHRARGSSQTTSRGGSSQISSYTASQVTAQSNQSTQEYVGSITSGITGGENGGRSQDASANGLPSIGGNISQAYSGCGALPFQHKFTKGSF